MDKREILNAIELRVARDHAFEDKEKSFKRSEWHLEVFEVRVVILKEHIYKLIHEPDKILASKEGQFR